MSSFVARTFAVAKGFGGSSVIPLDEPGAAAKEKGYRHFLRYACKMATGTGKTTVMGMLAAWSILNRVAAPTDDRFRIRS